MAKITMGKVGRDFVSGVLIDSLTGQTGITHLNHKVASGMGTTINHMDEYRGTINGAHRHHMDGVDIGWKDH